MGRGRFERLRYTSMLLDGNLQDAVDSRCSKLPGAFLAACGATYGASHRRNLRDGVPTVPILLSEERLLNPNYEGLQAHVDVLVAALGVQGNGDGWRPKAISDSELRHQKIPPNLDTRIPPDSDEASSPRLLTAMLPFPSLSPFVHLYRKDFVDVLQRLEAGGLAGPDAAKELRAMADALFTKPGGSEESKEATSTELSQNETPSTPCSPSREQLVAALGVLGVQGSIPIGHLSPYEEDQLPVLVKRTCSALERLGAPVAAQKSWACLWKNSSTEVSMSSALAALKHSGEAQWCAESKRFVSRWKDSLVSLFNRNERCRLDRCEGQPLLDFGDDDEECEQRSDDEEEEMRRAGSHDLWGCQICCTGFRQLAEPTLTKRKVKSLEPEVAPTPVASVTGHDRCLRVDCSGDQASTLSLVPTESMVGKEQFTAESVEDQGACILIGHVVCQEEEAAPRLAAAESLEEVQASAAPDDPAAKVIVNTISKSNLCMVRRNAADAFETSVVTASSHRSSSCPAMQRKSDRFSEYQKPRRMQGSPSVRSLDSDVACAEELLLRSSRDTMS